MISARSAQKAALKGLENALGGFIGEPQVEVQEGEGSLSMKIVFEVVKEGQISAGGETRKVKPGKYEMNVEVTFGKRGNMLEAHFSGKCGESALSDMYVVEENKLDYVRNWLSDKVGALAVQCATEAEETADIGGVLGW
ncbi:hypothetical protein [Ignicoccus hospitalis]|uniref:Uncharacterized protein n=1 Tax=Ignicoccus hospitalis (strain KIN4/I / DSM 18386 / JCM 14125) TaxID=453591 RepID=A8A940_IGNH4|nr:hypothetical protein [Ignicoccus hospitalis]ABU81442.1 hypothetical protein Igni_0258 [Ignicoccus hospitalis KIN4/I]HIH90252.1 hypothetical protein [Desulfurococcaceae archaeon]